METKDILIVYIVRNQDGKYFRAKGLRGYGESWVDEINKARVYSKIGPARSVVTFFTKKHPSFGQPVILKYSLNEPEILDETNRVKKSIERKAKQQAEQEKWWAAHKLEQAKKELDRAQQNLNSLINEQI